MSEERESHLLFHSSSADLRTHAQFVVLSATLQTDGQNKSPFFSLHVDQYAVANFHINVALENNAINKLKTI